MANYERAIQVLRDEGVLKRPPSQQTMRTVGCIGCRWFSALHNNEAPQVNATQVQGCLSRESGTIVPIMRKLEEVGAIEGAMEESDPQVLGRPQRKWYTPSATPLGEKFYAALDPVPRELCELPEPAAPVLSIEARCRNIVEELAIRRQEDMTQSDMGTIMGWSQARVSAFE